MFKWLSRIFSGTRDDFQKIEVDAKTFANDSKAMFEDVFQAAGTEIEVAGNTVEQTVKETAKETVEELKEFYKEGNLLLQKKLKPVKKSAKKVSTKPAKKQAAKKLIGKKLVVKKPVKKTKRK